MSLPGVLSGLVGAEPENMNASRDSIVLVPMLTFERSVFVAFMFQLRLPACTGPCGQWLVNQRRGRLSVVPPPSFGNGLENVKSASLGPVETNKSDAASMASISVPGFAVRQLRRLAALLFR